MEEAKAAQIIITLLVAHLVVPPVVNLVDLREVPLVVLKAVLEVVQITDISALLCMNEVGATIRQVWVGRHMVQDIVVTIQERHHPIIISTLITKVLHHRELGQDKVEDRQGAIILPQVLSRTPHRHRMEARTHPHDMDHTVRQVLVEGALLRLTHTVITPPLPTVPPLPMALPLLTAILLLTALLQPTALLQLTVLLLRMDLLLPMDLLLRTALLLTTIPTMVVQIVMGIPLLLHIIMDMVVLHLQFTHIGVQAMGEVLLRMCQHRRALVRLIIIVVLLGHPRDLDMILMVGMIIGLEGAEEVTDIRRLLRRIIRNILLLVVAEVEPTLPHLTTIMKWARDRSAPHFHLSLQVRRERDSGLIPQDMVGG
mmetsp:Transcript_39519/g.77177  ORF Transcript_39519/g.77177 Transcript_39519/m.77177 type:complete len:370 (-) Transcript_39519:3143-4252(-)